MTYEEAGVIFDRRRKGSFEKKLENNTYLRQGVDCYQIVLHSTIIITILPNGNYILNSGGWTTNLTRQRITKYSPARITQKKFRWWFRDGTPFADGIEIDKFGDPIEKEAEIGMFGPINVA